MSRLRKVRQLTKDVQKVVDDLYELKQGDTASIPEEVQQQLETYAAENQALQRSVKRQRAEQRFWLGMLIAGGLTFVAVQTSERWVPFVEQQITPRISRFLGELIKRS